MLEKVTLSRHCSRGASHRPCSYARGDEEKSITERDGKCKGPEAAEVAKEQQGGGVKAWRLC